MSSDNPDTQRFRDLYARAEDQDDWEDSLAGRILLILTGGLFAKGGFYVWAAIEPGSGLGGAAVVLMFATAVQLMLFGATGVDLERWGRVISLTALLALLLALLAALTRAFMPKLGTDALMFSVYSSQLVLEGSNPYTHSMAPAFELGGVAAQYSTPRINGENVKTLSYPAGAVVAFLPQAVLVGREPFGLRMTAVAATVAAGVLTIYDAPARLAIGGLTALMVSRNLVFTASGGLIDMLWVLPVLLTMRYWYREQYAIAAAFFGVACATKQNPWPIAAFLAVWLYNDVDTYRQFGRRAVTCIAVGLSVFTAINLPFIVDAPRAWLEGVLTPISGAAPMVHQGVGITLFTPLGVFPTTTGWHTMVMLGVFGALLVTYALYFEQLRWAAWLMPMPIYFVHYRSLTSYFVAFLPIVFYAALCQWGRLRTPLARPASAPVSTTEVSD